MDTKKMLNTVSDFELADGTVVKLTLTFYSLLQLKSKNKKAIYNRYNSIMVEGPKEELENATILYTAYLCANIDNIEACMDEITFLKLMPIDRGYIADVLQALINPKKK